MGERSSEEALPSLNPLTAQTTLDQMRVQMEMEQARDASFNARGVAVDALIGALATGLVLGSRSLVVAAGPVGLRIATAGGLLLTLLSLGKGFLVITNGVLRTKTALRLDSKTLKKFTRASWLSRDPERAAASMITTYMLIIERAHQINEKKAVNLNLGYSHVGDALLLLVATSLPAIGYAILYG